VAMKLPKLQKRYCAKCKKHTEHKTLESKKKTPGTAHPLSYGSKRRLRLRGGMKMGNKGRFSRRPVGQRVMTGKKQSKKLDLRFECSVCKKKGVQQQGMRAKKLELV